MSFRDELPKKAPPFWSGPNITTLLQSWGQALDDNAQVILDGRLQGIVFAGGPTPGREGAARLADGRLLECDPWVVPVHAQQRGIATFETESDLSKRIRASKHLRLKSQRGTPLGEMMHLRPYFSTALAYPVLWVQHTTGSGKAYWHKVDAAGAYSLGRAANFVRPGDARQWGRYTFFIELPGTGYTLGTEYDDGSEWNDGAEWSAGLTVTSAVTRDWVAMLTDWKASHSWLDAVVLVWQAGKLGASITPAADGAGRWNLPSAGQWATTNKRPKYMTWIYDNPT